MKRALDYIGEAFFPVGIASLTYAGFLCNRIVGFVVLGAGLITLSIMIARGNGNDPNGGDPEC